MQSSLILARGTQFPILVRHINEADLCCHEGVEARNHETHLPSLQIHLQILYILLSPLPTLIPTYSLNIIAIF